MSNKRLTPCSHYPIAIPSSGEDTSAEDVIQPGSLFRRHKRWKKRHTAAPSQSSQQQSQQNNNNNNESLPSSSSSTTTSIGSSSASTSRCDATSRDVSDVSSTARHHHQLPSSSTTTSSLLPTDEEWCKCGNCANMPLRIERKCCQNECFDHTNFQDNQFTPGRDCVLNSQLLLNTIFGDVNIQLSWFRQQRYLGFTGDALLFTNMDNSNYRFHAYRNYIDFVHGYLGRHNRRVIPACVVAHIRTKWPSPDGNYIGYKEPDVQDGIDDEAYIPPDELQAIIEGTEI